MLADLGADVDAGRAARRRGQPPRAARARAAAGEKLSAAVRVHRGRQALDHARPRSAGRGSGLPGATGRNVPTSSFSTSRAGEMERRGPRPPRTACRYPGLVFASITPYGLRGTAPWLAGLDLTAWASSGALPVYGDPDRAPLFTAGRSRVRRRRYQCGDGRRAGPGRRGQRVGRGQLVDISLQEAVLSVSLRSYRQRWRWTTG